MSVMRCTECGHRFPARSRFDVDGSCPECGCEELVEEDAYGDDVADLRCAECGFAIEAGIKVEWNEQTRVFTVDDDCPVCEAEGNPGQPLEPEDAVESVRQEPEYAVARAAARRLRGDTVGHGVPVDVEEVARRRGLTVERGMFEHDGMLRGTVIEVPSQHGRGPERFVIAHEVGHHELGHQGDRHKIEPEANAFASELLIPRDELTRKVKQGGTFRSLARHFDASQQAVVNAERTAKLLGQMRG
jgi:predicted RNA-binding Zn-ribbon protein involved in translation (DUF1610 family)